MFGIEKERLIENLEKIRSNVCAYANSKDNICDCKFGSKEAMSNKPLHEDFSGCAELRQVIKILQNLSENDFKYFCVKSGIVL